MNPRQKNFFKKCRTKSFAVIGYLRGNDGAILSAQHYPLFLKNKMVFFTPYNISFIEQACSVNVANMQPC